MFNGARRPDRSVLTFHLPEEVRKIDTQGIIGRPTSLKVSSDQFSYRSYGSKSYFGSPTYVFLFFVFVPAKRGKLNERARKWRFQPPLRTVRGVLDT